MLKERPILFSGPMVRAILDGLKTQTRRVSRTQPSSSRFTVGHYHPTMIDRHGNEQPGPEVFGAYDEDGEWGIPCPYGGPGDRLWVRETWRTGKSLDALNTTAMEKLCVDAGYTHPWAPLLYMADGTSTNDDTLLDFGSEWGRTRQSIYMPRWASRITLEVTDVRYERLQEITEKDATAEGIKRISKDGGTTWKWGLPDRDGLPGIDDDGMPWTDWDVDARVAFRNLWDRINGKRPGCSYGANPYVWAVSFKRIEMTL